MTRPSITPEAMAAITQRAPGRLVKKLDADPTMAERWSWTEGTRVETDSGEVVTIASADAEGITCSCLLSPKCLHVLAVARALPLGEAAPIETSAPAPVASIALDDSQRAAAESLNRVAAELLDAGAQATGAILEAELLRALHAARASGLHRAASSALRVVTRVRELAAERATFALDALFADVRELLEVTRALTRDRPIDARMLGTARRRYDEIGNLRVHGLFSEPIVTASGYAGVVTWVTDEAGRLYTLSDVMPGAADRARSAYEAGVDIGDATLSHRALARAGLFLAEATASDDARLGSGRNVRAASAKGTAWTEPPIATRFAEPLADQLARAHASTDPGADLLFVDATIVGLARQGLVLELASDPPLAVLAVAMPDDPALTTRESLALLARASGRTMRFVLRVLSPRRVAALALAPLDDALVLPERVGDRVCLGLDRLNAGSLRDPSPAAPSIEFEPPLDDATIALRRRLARMVLAGRASLPVSALDEVEREAAWLDRAMLRGGASAMRALANEARSRPRTLSGGRGEGEAQRLAAAWLAGAIYEREAERALRRRAWGA